MQTYLDTVNGGIAQLHEGSSTLNGSYGEFDAGVRQLAGVLTGMLGNLSVLTDGVNQLAAQYVQLDDGLNAYTDGVAQLKAGVAQLAEGASQLTGGTGELTGLRIIRCNIMLHLIIRPQPSGKSDCSTKSATLMLKKQAALAMSDIVQSVRRFNFLLRPHLGDA